MSWTICLHCVNNFILHNLQFFKWIWTLFLIKYRAMCDSSCAAASCNLRTTLTSIFSRLLHSFQSPTHTCMVLKSLMILSQKSIVFNILINFQILLLSTFFWRLPTFLYHLNRLHLLLIFTSWFFPFYSALSSIKFLVLVIFKSSLGRSRVKISLDKLSSSSSSAELNSIFS